MEGSQAIAVRSSTDLAQLDELEAILLGEVEPPEVADDPTEISREIMAQLLAAESDEELEQMGTAIGWRELLGVPVQLTGFRWRPSAFDGADSEGAKGPQVFFVIFGTRLDTGDRVTLTTGAGNVLAQLVNMARRQTLVGAIRSLKKADRPTARGYYPLWLETPESAKQQPPAGS